MNDDRYDDPYSQPPAGDGVDFDLRMRIGHADIRIRASIPQGAVTLAEFLPIVQSLTDMVTAAASSEAAQARRAISCHRGCGACCRQLVPIAEAEAIYLAGVLRSLDDDHRARVQDRCDAALQRLSDARLLEALRSSAGIDSRESRRALGLRYFGLGIACPFLEDASCSIHAHRPLACREYLVTSPARHCAHPDAGKVETLEFPRRPSALFYRFGDGTGVAAARWLALPLGLEWAQSQEAPVKCATFSGPVLFQRFVLALAGSPAESDGAPGTRQP
jgi:Fe-S-cluster containining protein